MTLLTIILGIFLGLFSTTYGGVQTKAQDTERQTDIKTLQSQLEAYYANNGDYPTLSDVNDASWRQQNMRGLDSESLKDPKGASTKLTAVPTKDSYSYAVAAENGKTCNDTSVDCTKYSLSATLDNGKPFTVESLN